MSSDPPTAGPRRSPRDGLIDATFVGAVLLVGLPLYLDAAPAGSGLGLGLDVGAGVLGAVALWWRRRWPLQIAVTGAIAGAFSTVASLAAVLMLFTVAVHRGPRALAALSAVNLVATGVLVLRHPDPAGSVPQDLGSEVLIMVAVVAWGMFIRARRQLLLSLRERAERAEAEQHWRFDQGRQLERTRIAREMHDVLGHRISLISMHAGALELRAEGTDGDVAESAAIIRASAHQALQDLREVIGVLRTEPEDASVSEPAQPALDEVPALIEESQRVGMNITFQSDVAASGPGVPAGVGRVAYRIVQEGLTNARKHAAGAAVLVQVSGMPGPGLRIELRTRRPVRPPAEPGPSTGQGLLGLAERAALVGGRFEHGRTPEGDFLLQCWLPWSAWQIPDQPQPHL